MPNSKCCLCKRRIPSNKNPRLVRQPHLWDNFKRYLLDVLPATEYSTESHICNSCHTKVQNYCNRVIGRQSCEVPDTPPSNESMTLHSDYIVPESEPFNTPQQQQDMSESPSEEQESGFENYNVVPELEAAAYQQRLSEVYSEGQESLFECSNMEDDWLAPASLPVEENNLNCLDSEDIILESEPFFTPEDQWLHESEYEELQSPDVEVQDSFPTVGSVSEVSDISQSSSTQSSSSTVYIENIRTCAASESACFICKSKTNRKHVPAAAKEQCWKSRNILIPHNNRCCPEHLVNGLFPIEVLDQIVGTEGVRMSSSDVGDLILHLTNKAHLAVNFSLDHLPEEKYHLYTGLKKGNFEELFLLIKHGLHNSPNRTAKNALGMFLCLMRLSISQTLIADLFGTKQTVESEAIDTVSKLLDEHLVPFYLGFGEKHMTREEMISKHGSPFYNKIYDQKEDTLKLILDGSYIFTEKPGNFEEQRKTYSGQKHRNLVKPMMITNTDGYIAEAAGCFFGNGGNNDANIMKYILKATEFKNFVKEGDCLIQDRGFRDSEQACKDAGLKVFMPRFLAKNQKQFTTEEANESRRVTLTRWTVEAVNGRLKNVFKFFETVIPGGYKGNISRFFRICCAISNKFFKPIFRDTPRHEEIAEAVLNRMDMPNLLRSRIEELGLIRQTVNWQKAADVDVEGFPKLSWDNLLTFTLGIYQLKMAERYTKEHVDGSPQYDIFLHNSTGNIVRAKLQSRFQSSLRHNVWVEYREEDNLSGILGHFCDCINGNRNVGVCSHITSVIRYLSYDRHQTPTLKRKRRPHGIIDAGAELKRMHAIEMEEDATGLVEDAMELVEDDESEELLSLY